jgi:hypothetical protein
VPKNTARSRWGVLSAAAVAVVVGLVGCNSNPLTYNWSDIPDTVQLYSLALPELNAPSGFDFFNKVTIRVEAPGATGNWDVALDTAGGTLAFLPPGALGITAKAGIATLPGMTLADVTKAPSDTLLYEKDTAAPIVQGSVYVVRSNQHAGSFGQSCVYYAKVAPVDIQVAAGTLTFQYVASPVCNSLDLVAPN